MSDSWAAFIIPQIQFVGEDFALPYIEIKIFSPPGHLILLPIWISIFLAAFIPRKVLRIFAGSKNAEKNRDSGKMHFSQISNMKLDWGREMDFSLYRWSFLSSYLHAEGGEKNTLHIW